MLVFSCITKTGNQEEFLLKIRRISGIIA